MPAGCALSDQSPGPLRWLPTDDGFNVTFVPGTGKEAVVQMRSRWLETKRESCLTFDVASDGEDAWFAFAVLNSTLFNAPDWKPLKPFVDFTQIASIPPAKFQLAFWAGCKRSDGQTVTFKNITISDVPCPNHGRVKGKTQFYFYNDSGISKVYFIY